MVVIIDYDAGNIKSVEKAIQHLGSEVVLSNDKNVIQSADRVILPGVGAFGHAMKNLKASIPFSSFNTFLQSKVLLPNGLSGGLSLRFPLHPHKDLHRKGSVPLKMSLPAA